MAGSELSSPPPVGDVPTTLPREMLATLAALVAQAVDALPKSHGLEPEGLSATDAAAFLGVSVSQFYDLDARGLVPEGVVIGDGRCRRWLRQELAAFLWHKAPSRTRWAMIRENAMRGTK